MSQSSNVYFRGGIIYLATMYFGAPLPPFFSEPIFMCSPTIQALSAYLPISFQATTYTDTQFIRKLWEMKPAPLPKAAKVRSWKRFEAGTSMCTITHFENRYEVYWGFPAERPGRGFIGKKEVPPTGFSLDTDLAVICAAMITHLTDPANRYPELARRKPVDRTGEAE